MQPLMRRGGVTSISRTSILGKIFRKLILTYIMDFLGKFELYNLTNNIVFVEILDYQNGSYELDDKNRIIGSDDVLNSDILENIDNIKQFCYNNNKEEYIRLLYCQKIVQSDIDDDGEVPKYQIQMDFIKLVKSVYKYWFRTEDFQLPLIPKNTRLTKKEEFYQLFIGFLESETATEEEVKLALYNKDYWKNPSEYIRISKARYQITTAELKAYSQFAFIDPKNTAND